LSIKKLGIFGGTFNPPHLGHLILAETAAEDLNLERIFFVPAGKPPHKTNKPLAEPEHRLTMVKLTAAYNSRFAVSGVDMDRPGPHYATDMVRIFQNHYPDAEMFFLMGSDSLRDLLSWHAPDQLISMTSLVVMQRPAIYPDLAMLSRELPGLLAKVHFLDAPEIEISSTVIVERLKKKQSVRYQVLDSVLTYLTEHKLYERDNS
jgi:nicotinate-nucleotide adenylyltransferase